MKELDLKAGNKYTTDSGLEFEVLELGKGKKPTEKDTVEVHYVGSLLDGTIFDSSVKRGQTVEFPLKAVIKGWTEGLQYMSVGSKFRFTIPADLAYGKQSPSPLIPADSTLIFEVQLISIK